MGTLYPSPKCSNGVLVLRGTRRGLEGVVCECGGSSPRKRDCTFTCRYDLKPFINSCQCLDPKYLNDKDLDRYNL